MSSFHDQLKRHRRSEVQSLEKIPMRTKREKQKAESRKQKAGTEPAFETWHGDPSEVCKWIDQHLGRIRTSEDVAEFFGVEAETLRRAFARNGIGTLWTLDCVKIRARVCSSRRWD
jgi:hypothetical protein